MDDNNKKPDLINETEPLDTETHAFSEETVTETGAAEEPETGPNGTVQGAAEPEKTGDLERMSELYEESLRRVQEGEVISGRIVSIDKDYAVVDISHIGGGIYITAAGVTRYGTRAALLWLANNLPLLGEGTYVLNWIDNGNGEVELSEIGIIYKK